MSGFSLGCDVSPPAAPEGRRVGGALPVFDHALAESAGALTVFSFSMEA